jgi:hypothetical protein
VRTTFIDPNAPHVFISYVHDNQAYALSLYNKLQEADIKPWLDKEKLRGGDNWDKEINKVIKQVDYFVALQSNDLVKRQIGYVNREICEALDRSKEFRGLQFIIPVRIDDSPFIEEFRHLHTIDLTDDKNLNELITTIKRDFAKRRK